MEIARSEFYNGLFIVKFLLLKKNSSEVINIYRYRKSNKSTAVPLNFFYKNSEMFCHGAINKENVIVVKT